MKETPPTRTYRDVLVELDKEALKHEGDVERLRNFPSPFEWQRLEINEEKRERLSREAWEALKKATASGQLAL